MRIRNIIGILCVIGIVSISGCSGHKEAKEAYTSTEAVLEQCTESQKEIFAMDTYMTVTAYGDEAEAAAAAAIDEIERLDNLLSTGSEKSEVGTLNKNGGGLVSGDTSYLLERASELYEDTKGAFDITIYPIMEVWGFTTQDFQVPNQDTLEKMLSLTDGSKVVFEKESQKISFALDGMKIDFGGIAKGYTSSRIIDIWKEYGITSGLVNLGGNVQTLGYKTDGSKWRVGVQNPENDNDYIGVLSVHDKAVITSGGYERYFEQDGIIYHHIIDPATGYPAKSGLVSVTIISADGTLADGLSTALFVMGKDKAIEFWKNHSDEFDAILMTEENVLYVTEGIASDFSSDRIVEIVKK